MTLDQIRAAIFAKRLPALKEAAMQNLIAERLAAAGVDYRREVHLGKKGRIDFEVATDDHGLVGIECKTHSTRTLATRQLTRYAESGRYKTLVLLSVMPYTVPDEINGLPVHRWQTPAL